MPKNAHGCATRVTQTTQRSDAARENTATTNRCRVMRSSSPATTADEHEQQRPDEIELLLDGERPRVKKRIRRGRVIVDRLLREQDIAVVQRDGAAV